MLRRRAAIQTSRAMNSGATQSDRELPLLVSTKFSAAASTGVNKEGMGTLARRFGSGDIAGTTSLRHRRPEGREGAAR